MIESKHLSKIIIVLMSIAVIFCLLAVVFSSQWKENYENRGITMEYESELFDTNEIMTVDIQIKEEDWEQMLKNVMSEQYYACDVVINGTKLMNVGIRPKGNTSLSNIVNDPDTDRYSFKLEFDQFVENQTLFGLDKLILNNNYADATNRKETLIYDMYQYLGADASLYNYAKVSVNGTYWGVYLALEAVEDSFLLRNYGTEDGELYKPESMGMGGDHDRGFQGGADRQEKNFNLKEMNGEPPADPKADEMNGEFPTDFEPKEMNGEPPADPKADEMNGALPTDYDSENQDEKESVDSVTSDSEESKKSIRDRRDEFAKQGFPGASRGGNGLRQQMRR